MPTPPSLRELQRFIAAQIRISTEPNKNPPGDSNLCPQRGTPGVDRLAIYAQGYLERIRQALAEVYESVCHVIGAEAFAELADTYARRYPSQEYNLTMAGRFLPALLAQVPLGSSLPFLPDLARLEWRVCEAFHAFDRPPLNPERLMPPTLETWSRIGLLLQPSVGIVESAWPVVDIWSTRHQPRETIALELADRPQRVLVYRDDVRVRCALLEPAQTLLLQSLQAGDSLGVSCERLAVQFGDELPVTKWFANWIRLGLIVDIQLV